MVMDRRAWATASAEADARIRIRGPRERIEISFAEARAGLMVERFTTASTDYTDSVDYTDSLFVERLYRDVVECHPCNPFESI
jgi:hypothetical protein